MKFLKSLVFNRYTFVSALIVLILPLAAVGQDTPAFDALRAEFENNRVYIAEFDHRYEDSFTGETQRTEGRIWIGRDQYKVEGENQSMVVDGEISRVYDGSKSRLIVSEYIEEEDDFAPSRMLQGVDESYSVEEARQDDGSVVITLETDDPFSIFSTVTIELTSEGLPREIVAHDQAENRLTTTFSDGRFSDFSDELFELTIPDGTEEIDLRYDSR